MEPIHTGITGLVHAENADDALSRAKRDVFEQLVNSRTFDYYTTFDQYGAGVSGRDRWGDLPVLAKVDSEPGEEIVEQAWDATVQKYQHHFNRISEFFENHETEDFWQDSDTHYEFFYDFNALGEYSGPSTYLYDEDAEGIRNRDRLNKILCGDENQLVDPELDLYAVLADVHY